MPASIRHLILDYWCLEEQTGNQCMFLSLLQLLPNLQQVQMQFSLTKAMMLNVGSFPSPFSISSVRHLILNEMDFDTIAHLYSLFSCFEQLETIAMSRIIIKDISFPNHLAPSHRCYPSTLDLELNGSIIEHLFSPQSTISLSSLRILKVVAVDADVFTVASLLSLVNSSLESLTLRLECWKYPAGSPIDLRQLRHLRNFSTCLRFYSALEPVDAVERWPSPLGHRFFETIPCSVEDIYIEVAVSPFDTSLLPKYRSDWQELDHILARHPLRFTVRLGIYIDYGLAESEYEEYFDTQWSAYGGMEEYFPNFLRFECMPEMNKLGRVDSRIVKGEITLPPYIFY
ncbi:uncharacterized protein EV420DRAFT_14608 [Desarmillaria tabescens]|uniref:Uncharacterized protein n=1 Tax=Armillaria tabescens TaxID=1929756 RepID=A0AA39NP15_ARMTA|nr:uncharacterized protein EV420DRAFT_14608 [Desarmillaria tabescens]KAK0469209.1 hypothetical protein EV420DRAFT_14608 [Desarmillaria tabescens]